ncbi:hypothetical protein Asulf_00511 [Archaeoglobus sulfaticallidus PM70-1]|uniref:Uncharacterized protein n=1 Tax=Archaeoglobus sulfaticallidus PM70-1 TaxID=387631 RepID=N0BAC2_9EURY|nr:hypothetical protein [Archaeoglobus sulfaticallidus]AGK60534.1 hypothetical protein Asulf_00511 [Archaeoglobus sulfaticallidus PM70-1]
MEADEFVAAIAAIHRYLMESRERPPEVKRGFSYWKMLSRL